MNILNGHILQRFSKPNLNYWLENADKNVILILFAVSLFLWKRYGKTGLSRMTGYLDAAVMQINDLFDNGKTDAVAFRRMGFVGLVKFAEDPVHTCLRDRISEIGNSDRDPVLRFVNNGFHHTVIR